MAPLEGRGCSSREFLNPARRTVSSTCKTSLGWYPACGRCRPSCRRLPTSSARPMISTSVCHFLAVSELLVLVEALFECGVHQVPS